MLFVLRMVLELSSVLFLFQIVFVLFTKSGDGTTYNLPINVGSSFQSSFVISFVTSEVHVFTVGCGAYETDCASYCKEEWLSQMYCDLRCVHRPGRDLNDQCKHLYDPNNSTTSFVPKQLIPYYAQFPNYVEVVGHRLFDDVRLKDPRISIKNASFIGTTFVRKARGYPGLIEQAYKQNLIPRPMISFSTDNNLSLIMIMGDYHQNNCEQWYFFPSLHHDRWVFRLDSISIGGLDFSGHKNNGYKTYFNSFNTDGKIELPNEIVDQMIQNNIVNESHTNGLTTTLLDISMNFTINDHVYVLPNSFVCDAITIAHECRTIFKRSPPIRLTEEPTVSFSDSFAYSPICLAFHTILCK